MKIDRFFIYEDLGNYDGSLVNLWLCIWIVIMVIKVWNIEVDNDIWSIGILIVGDGC